jgi:inorganic pyrophosphatase
METETSQSLKIAKPLLGKKVEIIVDRPLGSLHPKWKFPYEVNYGYVKGVMAPDGDELDAYVLLVDKAVNEFSGTVVAIVHRLNDDDDKLVVIPDGMTITDEEIDALTLFMEQWYKHIIVRS